LLPDLRVRDILDPGINAKRNRLRHREEYRQVFGLWQIAESAYELDYLSSAKALRVIEFGVVFLQRCPKKVDMAQTFDHADLTISEVDSNV